MLKPVLAFAFAAALATGPALAQATAPAPDNAVEADHDDEHGDHDHDDEHGHDGHDDHAVAAGTLTVTHPWARAAAAGAETMVFLEIDNDGETDTLEGASSEVAGEIAIVGFSMAEGRQTYVDVGPVEVDAGEFEFDPFGLGLRLSGLTRQLQQGDTFSMTLDFAATGPVEITVEVEAADATQHSHAGHAH